MDDLLRTLDEHAAMRPVWDRWTEYGRRVTVNLLEQLEHGRSETRPFHVSREGLHRLSYAAAADLRQVDVEGYARAHPVTHVLGVPVKVVEL